MRDFRIVTDSCSDLGKDIRSAYDIDYVKMNIVTDGQSKPASLDWDLYSPRELYDTMRGGKRITTTQVPPEEFATYFGDCAEKGVDVLYIGCASALSGSVNTGTVIARSIMEKNPEMTIVCIDSLASCLGEGAIVVRAARLKAEGKSLSEVAAWVEENRLCCQQFCTVDTLDYLARAGRIKASKAFFGNLFGVKPIIISDAKGNNLATGKAKGRANALQQIVSSLKEILIDSENQTIYIAHGDCEADAEKLRELVRTQIPCKDIYVNYIGPIIGASVGPGAVAVFGFGKKVEAGA